MNKALFLDRDGVINIDHGYIYQPKDIEFVPGMFQQAAREHNIDFSQSVMVGDKPSDIAAANLVGISRTFSVDNQTIEREKLNDFSHVVTKLSQITLGSPSP